MKASLLRIRGPIVGEAAHVAAEARVRIGIGQAGDGDHRAGPEQLQQRRARAAARDLALRCRLEIALEQRPGGAAERRLRRKAVEHRHVLEHMAQAVAIALAVALAQQRGCALGIGLRMARAHEAANDLGRCDVARVGLQGVAPEQVHLLELREQAVAGRAARGVLHFMDGQEFAVVEAVGVELGAVVEVAGDDQHVATHAAPAGRSPASRACRAAPVRRTGTGRAANGAGTLPSRRTN